MNELIEITTMSSREIAELTGKRHDNVLSDCYKLNENYRNMTLPEISGRVYLHPNTGRQLVSKRGASTGDPKFLPLKKSIP